MVSLAIKYEGQHSSHQEERLTYEVALIRFDLL